MARPEVKGFRPRHRFEAEIGHARASAGILDAGPGEEGIDIVAAVHEDGAGRDLVADLFGRRRVLRPDRGREAVGAVVHQPDRLFVRGDLHDADDGAERLLHHHFHRMVDPGQHLRHQIGRADVVGGKAGRVDQRRRALGDRLGGMIAHDVREARRGHRAERRLRIERIAEPVGRSRRGESFDEAIVEALVHIDALDAAAALPGIVEGAVDDIGDRIVEVGVGPHIGRVLAAEFEAERGEGSGRRALDRLAASDRAGEVHMIDAARGDEPGRPFMVERDGREQPFRQADAIHRLLESLADQKRLRRVLQQHGVAGEERGDDGIERRQIGVVPRRDHQHHARRRALDHAAEAGLLRRDIGFQRFVGEFDQRFGALDEAAHFAAVTHRAPHLERKLWNDIVVHPLHGGDEIGHLRLAVGERDRRPFALRAARLLAGRPRLRARTGQGAAPPRARRPGICR